MNLFDMNGPLMNALRKLANIILCNIAFCLLSLPLFTVGAALTALYACMQAILTDDEDDIIVKQYWDAFRRNFKQATVIWLLMLLTGFILGFDLYFFLRVLTSNSVFRTVFTAAIGALSMIWLCIFSYVFPLQCRFYNPVKRTLFNAFFMSIRHFFHTLGMLVLDVLVVVFFIFSIYYMPQVTVLSIMFGFPLIAFINSYILNPIFNKYIPEEEKQENPDELRPILQDVVIEHPEKKKQEEKEEEK